MSCTDCGVGQVSGTIMENLTTLVAPLVNKGMPLIKFTRAGALGLTDFLFEKKEVESDGDTIIIYKFKDGLGAGSKFQRVWTNENCQLEWREQLYTAPVAKLSVSATGTNVITVDNINGLRGIGVGSNIIIQNTGTATVPGKVVVARITSINGNEITLATGTVVTADIGTCVYRGTYAITNDCGATFTNSYKLKQSVKYVSNFRRLNISLEFKTCDLSLDRLVNYLGTKNGAELFVLEFQQAAVEGFVHEFKKAFWRDRNLKDGYDLDGTQVSTLEINETMGVFPAMKRAAAVTGQNYTINHKLCCDANGNVCGGDSALVSAFFANIRAAYDSGLYTNKKVTVVGNKHFESAVLQMQAAFQEVNGVSLVYNVSDTPGYTINQTLPSLNLGGIKVDFVYDDELDFIGQSFYIIVPSDHIYIKQREYPYLDENMKVTREINNTIMTGFPWLRFTDVTYLKDWSGRCREYYSDFEFAIILAGMEQGAWRAGIGLEPCNIACDICDASMAFELL